MQQDTGVTAIAHVIQLSVAPVFLLTGIGAFLGVMANRLARVVDRARALDREELEGIAGSDAVVALEISALARRARLISRSISLCTVTALLICAVIVVLFAGASLGRDTSVAVASLFVTAMFSFFVGLLLFLREILLATATVQIGLQHVPRRPVSRSSGTG